MTVLALFPLATAHARDVSYPGGTTLMLDNDGDRNSFHLHYSPTAKYSIGLRSEYDRTDEFQMHSVQLNNLLKRWNNPDSQANLYLKSGAGYAIAKGDAEQSPAAFTGLGFDWEDRRYFTSYENRYVYAGDVGKKYSESARVGIAPYIAEFGSVHTWLMLQVDHKPTSPDNDHFTATPLVRLFYNTHLLETGVSDNGDMLFNYYKRF